MITLRWAKPRLVAEFRVPSDEARVVRVEFSEALIFRALDEMALSTEEPAPSEGLVSEHLAYKVRDAAFFLSQSEAFRAMNLNVEHYRFITGWTCLDVIAVKAPSVALVARN
jgi:hypothetical protein